MAKICQMKVVILVNADFDDKTDEQVERILDRVEDEMEPSIQAVITRMTEKFPLMEFVFHYDD